MNEEPEQLKPLLTQEELLAIWQLDEYWGEGGSYLSDPYTGIRTLNKE
jgi:hypothetical protein